MRKPSELESRIAALIEPAITGLGRGIELIDIEFTTRDGQRVLTIFIDKQGGVSLDDCSDVSLAIDPLLDQANPIDTNYLLEVSSPGWDRPFQTESDFQRNVGILIALELKEPFDKRSHFEGILKQYDEEMVTVELNEPCIKGVKPKTNGSLVEFERANIRKVCKAIRF